MGQIHNAISLPVNALYKYEWLPGPLVPEHLLEECVGLYSSHYGIWGAAATRPGARVTISAKKAKEWLDSKDSNIALARTEDGLLVGYAIIVETKVPDYGIVSWVTQLVVHEGHRRLNIAKVLLFTTWKASNRFAWGVITANPYAVRALEKATRRRCIPARVAKNHRKLKQVGTEHVPYIHTTTDFVVDALCSRVDTEFLLDHSQIPEMIASVTSPVQPWLLGDLPEGWEWFAFTFHDQEQISLTHEEFAEMLRASDQITRKAYARMTLDDSHVWAKHTDSEVTFAIEVLGLKPGDSILDFGCGNGRHSTGLAKAGLSVTGVDYALRAANRTASNPIFVEADCRTVSLVSTFNAGICLYDVIGSFPDEDDNAAILRNLAKHLRPGSLCLISVMNLVSTLANAVNRVDVSKDPDKLLLLPPSNTMEKTGNVFDPAVYLVDPTTDIVYRKEQFTLGQDLPEELLVRDKRYTKESITALCIASGLEVVWSRFVRAGSWSTESDPNTAKELLILARVTR